MLPYYVAYGVLLIVGVVFFHIGYNVPNANKRYCILFAVIWTVLLGFRHPAMGVDLRYGYANGYLGRFVLFAEMDWRELLEFHTHYEEGYLIFTKLLGYISTNGQFLIFVCGAITIITYALWLHKNSTYPMLSVFILIGLPSFLIAYSGLRQAIAIAITIWAFEMIKRKKLVFFVLLVLLAVSFHSSAIVFLIAYPVYHIRLSTVPRFYSLFAPIVVYVFRVPLFEILSRILKRNAQIEDTGAITLFIIFCLIYVFAVAFGHEEDREETGLRNLFLLACLCQAFGSVYNTAIRVGYYFMVYLALLLPRIITNLHGRSESVLAKDNRRMMYLGISVCFVAFGLWQLSRVSWAMSNPYWFFWQEGI